MRHIGSGLVRMCGAVSQSREENAPLDPKSVVAIFCRNCPEWLLLDGACHAYSLVVTGVYEVTPLADLSSVLNSSGAEIVCVGEKVAELAKAVEKCPNIKTVVLLPFAQEKVEWREGINVVSFVDVEIEGSLQTLPPVPPLPSSFATICYTSGTTGNAKGVELTHANMIASLSSVGIGDESLSQKDVYFSYLPLVHIFERTLLQYGLHKGVAIGFYRGDILRLMEDAALLQPTVFTSVPRIFNRFNSKIEASISQQGGLAEFLYLAAHGSLKRKLVRHEAMRAQLCKKENRTFFSLLAYITHRLYLAAVSKMYSVLVLSKIQQRLGGQVRLFITGAAPISARVLESLAITFGAKVISGYGCSETAVCGACTYPQWIPTEDCGAVSGACQVKIEPIPELENLPEGHGEICVRGASVFRAYLNDEEATRKAKDDDDFYHTGDLGTFTKTGALKITGRIKEIFKLSQGEYITPAGVEATYLMCELVEQIFVYGDSLKSQLVALVYPNEQALTLFAARHGINESKFSDLCSNEQVIKLFLTELDNAADGKLRGFEKVKGIWLLPEPMGDKYFTPTKKLKRNILSDDYRSTIDSVYRRMGVA
eukprot:CAMPEP_0201512958 /NCGR_PEP_ID=MMETSP0161_2-20130828/5111_1 /ASSEMBLY_ACC=CAM_ASM_000251 /TAXON_ID=180227 /ORGANISM="Neoparamoeba aestuarina, Strain SoJaBio B1-5/56/2" /LENGTH=596 /DNA_ID=CAMNT_0047908997 /DNA_START=632 /DNA_END=2422 /DNA_ORIENTATION=-